MARTKSVKILTSTSLSGLSSKIDTEIGNGYELVTNSAPTMTGSDENSLAWVCAVEAGELSYNELNDLPTFETIPLSGALTYESLSIMPSGDYATNTELALKLTPDNILAGGGITLDKNGLNVTINSTISDSLVYNPFSVEEEITLSANTKYKIRVEGAISNFYLPPASALDTTKENSILIYFCSVYNNVNITWDQDVLYYDSTPFTLLPVGYSDIVLTFEPFAEKWCVGYIQKA